MYSGAGLTLQLVCALAAAVAPKALISGLTTGRGHLLPGGRGRFRWCGKGAGVGAWPVHCLYQMCGE